MLVEGQTSALTTEHEKMRAAMPGTPASISEAIRRIQIAHAIEKQSAVDTLTQEIQPIIRRSERVLDLIRSNSFFLEWLKVMLVTFAEA